jgi:hypothetical protein
MPTRTTTGITGFLTPTRETRGGETQGQEKPGRETDQRGGEKEATPTTTGETGRGKILTQGINLVETHGRVRDNRREPLTKGINNPLKEPLVTQEPRPRPPLPSSAELIIRDMEGKRETMNPTTMDLTLKAMQPITLVTLVIPGTEGPRESATTTTKKKTP